MIPITDLNAVQSLCNLFDSLATVENGVTPQDTDFYFRMVMFSVHLVFLTSKVELWFLFSLIWSIGASVSEESRKKVDMFLRGKAYFIIMANFFQEIEGQFPKKDTVFEYVVDPVKKGWAPWDEKVKSN